MNTSANPTRAAIKRPLIYRSVVFAYGVAAYLVFLATFLYAIGFIGNFGVPKSLDSPALTTLTTALAINVGLLSIFALQHSIMARRGFKRFLTRFIPATAERSTYVLASSVALALMFWKWQPLGGAVWQVEASAGRILLYAAYAFGWTLVLVATFAINHFDLFGLCQVWAQLLDKPPAPLRFSTPALYRMVRHPLYLGWLFVFWSTPDMTATHLFFAVATTAYILIAVRFEEADLMHDHPEYSTYRQKVPMLIPRLVRSGRKGDALQAEPSPASRAMSAN